MKKRGFTLIEVLIALAILSSAIIIVFQIFSFGFRNLAKIGRYQDLYIAMNNIVEEIDLITDFEQNKKKSGKAGEFEYEWQATPHSPKQRMTTPFEENISSYMITLYKIVLKIYYEARDGRRELREFTFYKVGWADA